MIVPTKDRLKENAMYEGIPTGSEKEGRIPNPFSAKSPTLKSGMTRLTINSAMTLFKNLKSPKVMRFKGSKRRFIIGLAKRDAIAKAIVVITRPAMPFLNSKPVVIWETKNKIKVQIIMVLRTRLITLNSY